MSGSSSYDPVHLERLAAHRELQLLRAAHRPRRSRRSERDRADYVAERARKLTQVQRWQARVADGG